MGYYLDPCIVKPLTFAKRLSYSELVGPKQVQWFISHWWGTEFRITCATIYKHAHAIAYEKEGHDEEKEPEAWKQITYWICTFSNNQWKVKDEVGATYQESSFYLAVRSQSCKGTCMILDERAMPLTRAWCLFELLETMIREQDGRRRKRNRKTITNRCSMGCSSALQLEF